jgi:mannose-6-phosphate isomerase-like protein (cupin superfamily)
MTYIDPVQVSPSNYRLLLENDRVRVLEMTLRAGERDETHSHPAETVYFVRGGKARITLADGGSAELDLADGHVMWHEPWTHQVENVGDSEIRAVIVETKDSLFETPA